MQLISGRRKILMKNSLEFDWVERIRNSDESAFRDLFKDYYQVLVNHACRYVQETHIAENIVQDIFLNIWKNRKDWRLSISLKAYLYQAVRNRSLNQLRRLETGHDMLSDIADVVPSDENPEDYFREKEMVEQIQQAIDSLPERSRSIFMMHRYDNLKYAEIAEILNISVGTVETHMVRALKFLRARLFEFLAILF